MRVHVEERVCPVNEQYYGLLQEQHGPSVYRVLCVTIMCTKTQGSRAAPILKVLFEVYPSAQDLALASTGDVETIVGRLGLQKLRAKRLISVAQYLVRCGRDVMTCPGIGKYGTDSIRIFCFGEWRDVRPDDKELLRYVRWRWQKEGIDYDSLL